MLVINHGRVRQTIDVDGKEYHVLSKFYKEEHVVYRNFMVSRGTELLGIYKLGITKVALLIYNYKKEFKPPAWLFEQGLAMLREMIVKNDFSKESGVITTLEMSKNQFICQELEPLSLEEEYSR